MLRKPTPDRQEDRIVRSKNIRIRSMSLVILAALNVVGIKL
jgi:hypothetical protein